MSIFLGIDAGTQSVKVICFDTDSARVVDSASSPLQLISLENGAREQMAEWWIAALHQCMDALQPSVKKAVRAIGVSGQQHGFVALGKSGDVLAPVKLWCDTSTQLECEAIVNAVGGQQRCIAETGNNVLPGYTASKILWLKRNKPALYAQMSTILLPHDYINFYLTGELTMECGDASGTGLFDVRRRNWHSGLLKALDGDRDLAECLPPVLKSNQVAGQLRDSLANTFGLPKGISVSSGGGDNMMAAIGTGNVLPGRMTVSLGTSGTLFAYSDSPVIDESGTIAAFCDSTGGWLPLVCTMNCTVATELTRNAFRVPLSELDARIGSVAVGSDGVITLPFFQGERVPNLPAARGCILGLHNTNYSQDHLLRSAMESAVYGLRSGLEVFQRQGMQIDAIRLTGGGAESAVWRQMVADVFNLPVVTIKGGEGAALGAALQAYWVSQLPSESIASAVEPLLALDESQRCEPHAATASLYNEHFMFYQKHLAAIAPLYQAEY